MTDNPKALIGCPEVISASRQVAGGITASARILGKSKALDMILFSKSLQPPEALAIGLVEQGFPAAD